MSPSNPCQRDQTQATTLGKLEEKSRSQQGEKNKFKRKFLREGILLSLRNCESDRVAQVLLQAGVQVQEEEEEEEKGQEVSKGKGKPHF